MILTDRIHEELKRHQEVPSVTEVTLWLYLVEAQHRLDSAAAGDLEAPVRSLLVDSAALAAMCGFLLDQLHQTDPGQAADVAWILQDWDGDGELAATWVAQEVARRRIDVAALGGAPSTSDTQVGGSVETPEAGR